MLKERAIEGNQRTQNVILQALQDVDPVVRAHAVENVFELTDAEHLHIDEDRNKIDKLMLIKTDLSVQMLAIEVVVVVAMVNSS